MRLTRIVGEPSLFAREDRLPLDSFLLSASSYPNGSTHMLGGVSDEQDAKH